MRNYHIGTYYDKYLCVNSFWTYIIEMLMFGKYLVKRFGEISKL